MGWASRSFRREPPRRHNQPSEFSFGYLHPDGGCPHDPPCSPQTAKPFGGNDQGSRCKPQPKQALAHVSKADILFYGGAVGGGKSEFAIVEAVMLCLEYAGSKVAIFRRTLTQLEQELEGRIILLTWADDKTFRGPNGKLFCKYNKQRHVFKFWNGSELHLCYCNRESDVYKYQSFQIIGLFIDESSHFTQFMVDYLCTRVRSPRKGVPKVIRLTSNPGNVGHGWHKRWFVRPTPEELGPRPDLAQWINHPTHPAPPDAVDAILHGRRTPQPFEVWRPLPPKNRPIRPDQMMARQFIPAWFHDNFALADADPNYLASKVYILGGDKAKQLAEGDWDANESMIVGAHWEVTHVVQDADEWLLKAFPHLQVGQHLPWHVLQNDSWRPAPGTNIFGSVDYGYGAPWSFHLHAALPGGHTRTFFEDYGARKRDAVQADIIKRALEGQFYSDNKTPLMEGIQWIVYDPQMKNSRQEMGLAKTIIEVYQDKLPRVQFLAGAGGRPARLSRPNRWMDALSIAPDGLPWWSCTTACPDLIRTVPEVPWDEEDPDVEDDDSENHCIAAGTLIETRDGRIPIEQVCAGDDVLTRDGYRTVERAWQVSPNRPVVEVLTDTGHRLLATGDHRIWTENRGFIRVDALAYEDILLTDEGVSRTCQERQKPPSSSRPRFRNGVDSGTTGRGATSRGSAALARSLALVASIVTSGKTCMTRFRRGVRSITRTRTEPIITLITSSFARTASTNPFTGAPSPTDSERPGALTSGLHRPLVSRFLRRFQSSADAGSRSTCRGPVSENIARRAVGSARVTSVAPAGRAAVYDLTVRSTHEFLAAGLLVHNCYEDCGRFFEARPHAAREKPEDLYQDLDPISRQHQLALEKKRNPGGADIPSLYVGQ